MPFSSLRRFARPAAFFASVLVLLVSTLAAADTLRRGATETALDRYIAKPDPAFAWTKLAETKEPGITGYALELVSQQWLTSVEVNRPEWRHSLAIVKPDDVRHATALLYISGGANRPGPPARPSRALIEIAKQTHSVVFELRMVPNQPLVFNGDGIERQEDDLIAYSWTQFLKTGDERWPARLPMTKSAVRAMDAVTAFLASEAGGGTKIETFVVAGASKRGWTAWTAAAVDTRIIAFAPIVIDVLNTDASMEHHFRAYGFFAPAVGDYVKHGIMTWAGTPELKALYAIEDPFAYRDRLTMPKLIMNASGDQFFLPDSAQLYLTQIPGENALRYVPNTDHGLRNADVFQTLGTWYQAILDRTPRPKVSWQRTPDGTITVKTDGEPSEALLWQATNPAARDFRLEKLGAKWTSTPLTVRDGAFIATVPKPEQGWTASFVELTFTLGGAPYKVTTDIAVTPDTLPFAAPDAPKPKGFITAPK